MKQADTAKRKTSTTKLPFSMKTRITKWVVKTSLLLLCVSGIFYKSSLTAQPCSYAYQNLPLTVTLNLNTPSTSVNQATLTPILGVGGGGPCQLYIFDPLTLTWGTSITIGCNGGGNGAGVYNVMADDNGVIDGNSSAIVAVTIIIIDTQAPTIICPANVSGNTSDDGNYDCILNWNAGGGASIGMTNVSPLAAALPGQYGDNCSSVIAYQVVNGASNSGFITGSDAGVFNFTIGTSTVTYRVTDFSGTTATCSFTVTVSDNEDPIWQASSITGLASQVAQSFTLATDTRTIVLDCNNANYSSDLNFLINTYLPTAADNCDINPLESIIDVVTTPLACTSVLGINNNYTRTTIRYRAIDASGNLIDLVGADHYTLNIFTSDNKGPNYASGSVPSGPAVEILPNFYTGPARTLNVSDYYNELLASTPCGINIGGSAPVNAPIPSFIATATDCQNITYAGWIVVRNLPTPFATFPLAFSGNNPAQNPAQFLSVGSYVITYFSRDACFNFSSYQFQVNIVDDVDPIVTGCPANIVNIPNEAGSCIATVAWTRPIAIDNCSGALIASSKSFIDPDGNVFPIITGGGAQDFGVFPVGTSQVNYVWTDGSGNTSTCQFTVTVVDVEAPTLTCSGNQVLNSICINAIVPDYRGLANIFDNCQNNGFTVTQIPTPGTLVSLVTTLVNGSTFQVRLIVKDAANNPNPDPAGGANECTFMVTLSDQDAPIPTLASLPTINPNNTTSASCGSYALTAPTATDCNGNLIYGKATISGATFNAGPPPIYTLSPNNYVITWIYDDGNGNTATQIQIVQVTVDNTTPVLNCPTNKIAVTAPGVCTATSIPGVTMIDVSPHIGGLLLFPGALSPNQGIDNCDITQFSYSVAGATTVAKTVGANVGGVIFNEGINTVTYFGRDAVGLEGTCTFTITVNDNQLPTFTCGPNVSLGTGDSYDVNKTDCAVNLSNADASFNISNVNDNCGIQSVSVALQSVNPASAVYTAGPSASSLGGSTFNIAATPTNQATFTLRWTVTDVNGNVQTCDQTILVFDDTDPVIICKDEDVAAGNNLRRNTSADGITGDCIYVVSGAEFDPTSTDNCDASVTLTHNYAGSPSNMTLAGASFDGGTTVVTWTATDNYGNISTCQINVIISDDEDPIFVYCPNNVVLPNLTANCSNIVTWLRPSAVFGPDIIDNCASAFDLSVIETISNASVQAAITNNYPYSNFIMNPIGNFPVGITTITYTAEDLSGNTATCSFSVTIQDVEPPVLANPGTLLLPSICPNALVPDCVAKVNVFDNCQATVKMTQVPAAGTPLSVVFAGNPGGLVDGGTFPITITAMDANALGLMTSVTFNMVLDDQQNPVPNIVGATLPPASSSCGSLTLNAPTANDCGVTIFGIPNTGMFVIGSNPPRYTFGVGSFNVIWTYIDGQNNTSSQSQLISVTPDITAPQLVCPADITVNSPSNACSVTGITSMNVSPGTLNALGLGQYADLCGVVSVTYSISGATIVAKKPGTNNTSISSEVLQRGVNFVTYFVSDAAGNESTCSARVTVRDVTAPVFSGIPVNVTVNCESVPTAPGIGVVGGVNATDNCAPTPTITFNEVSTKGNNANLCSFYNYTITRTWTATDASGNVTVATQTITVKDDKAPVLNASFPTVFTGVNDINLCTKLVNIIVNSADVTDNCAAFGNLTITNTSIYGPGTNVATGNYPVGSYTFKFTVSDPCGNETTRNVTVTITDTQAPNPACVLNVGVPIGATGSVTLNPASFNAGSFDNCPGPLTFSLNPATVTCANVGTTILVILTVTDAAGNAATCQTFVEVQDNVVPTFTSCPANITVSCTSSLDPALNPALGNPSVTDNCKTIVTFADVAIAPAGTNCAAILRTWRVRDDFNNSSTCAQIIQILDNTPPTFNVVLPADVTLACGSTVPTASAVTATDFCDASVAVSFTQTSTKTSNNSCTDFNYVVTRTWVATDDCNNKSTHTQKITVQDIQAPVYSNVPGPIVLFTNNFNSLLCSAPVTLNLSNNITDCQGSSNITVTNSFNSGGANASGTYPVGVTNVVFTATDKCGNASTVVVIVTVVDNSNPIAKCDDLLNVTINSSGFATVSPLNVDEGSIDNCTPSNQLVYSLSKTLFDCTTLGNNLVTLTVVDQQGNSNTCTSIINISGNNLTTITLTFSSTNASTPIATDGSATVVVTGGSGNFSYLWNDPNISTTPTVNGLAAGTYNVTVTDNATGCKGFGSVTVLANTQPSSFTISGNITTPNNLPVGQAQVGLTGNTIGSFTTTSNGNFNFVVPNAGNAIITPKKNINPVNGVTALDLAIIQQHVLNPGSGALTTPYQLIAADANNDASINGIDLAVAQAVILNNIPNFPNNESWVFVPKSYVFPNPLNPFAPVYQKSLTFNNVMNNITGANFWGIKVADVQYSADPLTATGNGNETREYVADMKFIAIDQNVKKDQTYTINFRTQDFEDILGYQFTLGFDPEYLELVSTLPGDLPGMSTDYFGTNSKDQGLMTAIWFNNNSVSLDKSEIAFSIKVKAKKSGKMLSNLISLNDKITSIEAYNGNKQDVNIGLKFIDDEISNQTPGFELYQNEPNPFQSTTAIRFNMPQAEPGFIDILDMNGRLISRLERNFTKGMNREIINLDGVPSGILYYTVKSTSFSATKKMVIID